MRQPAYRLWLACHEPQGPLSANAVCALAESGYGARSIDPAARCGETSVMDSDLPIPPASAARLSALPQPAFAAFLGGIYEHSPWIAERAWHARPFADRAAIAAALEQVLRGASHAEQLALIRAHPELTGRAGVRSDLTADSSREQRGAGLDQCTPQEFAQLNALNRTYRERCGFPFILAVAGRDRQQIIANLAERVHHAPEQEFVTALEQIVRIAAYRLALLVTD